MPISSYAIRILISIFLFKFKDYWNQICLNILKGYSFFYLILLLFYILVGVLRYSITVRILYSIRYWRSEKQNRWSKHNISWSWWTGFRWLCGWFINCCYPCSGTLIILPKKRSPHPWCVWPIILIVVLENLYIVKEDIILTYLPSIKFNRE